MAQKPATRLRKLREIAEQLRREETVAKRKLVTWLGADYALVEEGWEAQKQLRDDIKDKPVAVRKYEKLLHKALFFEARAQTASKRRYASAKLMRSKADTAFERALEHLDESYSLDQELQDWFDRRLDFTADGELQACVGRMPLVVTSRSSDKQGNGLLSAVRSKRDITIYVVEYVIAMLERDAALTDEQKEQADKVRLNEFLALNERDEI